MFGKELVQNCGFCQLAPQDLNAAATGSAWIDMSKYGHATFIFMAGESADDAAITFKEATSNTGTGSQTLAFSKYFSTGQKLLLTSHTGTFVAEETVEGGTSGLTAYVHTVSDSYLLIIPVTGGTTWTDGETLTGGTSGATAVLNGTGQDEDTLLDRTCSSTFTYASVTFKTYAVEIDADSLDVDDGYRYVQANIANPGGASIGAGLWILSNPRQRGVPMPSAIGTQKIVADFA